MARFSNVIYSKRVLILSVLVFLFVAIPRILPAPNGLPYMQFWDEPQLATGAINALKRDNIFPYVQENLYGGFLRYSCVALNAIYLQYLKITDPTVESVQDVKTDLDGLSLTISHSGFYYWMRVYVAILNSLCFVFLFLLARLRWGVGNGLIAVLILASLEVYYNTASLALTSLPLGTMIMATMYYAVLFNHSKKLKHLVISLVFAGLGASTKMTGASFILIPFFAAAVNYREIIGETKTETIQLIAVLGLVPIGVFLLVNPHVYLNSGQFFEAIKFGSEVYRTGAGHLSREPGWEHFMYQIGEFTMSFGPIPSILIGVGLVATLVPLVKVRKPEIDPKNSDGAIISLFPIIYLVFVTSVYAVAYHRTFFLLYPIFALLAAEGISYVINVGGNLLRPIQKIRRWSYVSVVGIMAIAYGSDYHKIYARAKQKRALIDTRTVAIDHIRKIGEKEQIYVGIAKGLHISPEDLRKIPLQYWFFDHLDIKEASRGFTHLLVPSFDYGPEKSDTVSMKVKQTIDDIVVTNLIEKIEGNDLMYFHARTPWEPMPNPAIHIVRGSDYPPPKMSDYEFIVAYVQALSILDHIPDAFFHGELGPGRYMIRFRVSGQPALGEYPKVALVIDNQDIDSLQTHSTNWVEGELRFTLRERFSGNLYLRVINDYWNPETQEDRNIWIQDLELMPEYPELMP